MDYFSFPGLDILRLSLLDMDPVGTLLAGVAYNENAELLRINIPKRFIGSFSEETCTKRLQHQLSRFIAWNRCNKDSSSDMLLYDNGEEVPNTVVIDLVDENNKDVPFLTIENQNKKKVVTDFCQVGSEAVDFDDLLISKVTWNLHVVIGFHSTEIVFKNIDGLMNNNSVTETFELLFTRPGLD